MNIGFQNLCYCSCGHRDYLFLFTVLTFSTSCCLTLQVTVLAIGVFQLIVLVVVLKATVLKKGS